MIQPYANVMHLVGNAGTAFAPASAAIEPTPAEAVEEYRRAVSYRNDARLLGLAVGGAAGLLLFAFRRK